jgi:ribosomal protein S15P/S13E
MVYIIIYEILGVMNYDIARTLTVDIDRVISHLEIYPKDTMKHTQRF